jgi:hypothetical protein
VSHRLAALAHCARMAAALRELFGRMLLAVDHPGVLDAMRAMPVVPAP